MSYPIKFRVWDKEKSQWLKTGEEPDLVHEDYTSQDSETEYPIYGMVYSFYEEEMHEVSLFTGARDCDGKEIFEGDIILPMLHEDEASKYLIYYCEQSYMWRAEVLNAVYSNNITLSSAAAFGKIIGNKWEDEELMNESNSN